MPKVGNLTLTGLVAPPYWRRYRVDDADGTVLGHVERRGGFGPWRATLPGGTLVGTMYGTRDGALAALTDTPRQPD